MKKFVQLLVLAGAFFGAAAQAAVTPYFTFASFSAAVTGAVENSFEGIADPGGSYPYHASALTLSGVSFAANGSGFVIDGIVNPFPGNPSYFSAQTGTPINSLTVTPVGSESAMGFYYGMYNPPVDSNLSLVVNGGSPIGLTIDSANTTKFVGITSTSPITSLVFTNANNSDTIELTKFVIATAIPEPSIPALFVIGLALIGTIVRRKSR